MNSSITFLHDIVINLTVPMTPCQPHMQPLSSRTTTSARICWSRSTCSQPTYAAALQYYVSCSNRMQTLTSTLTTMCTTVSSLHPNTHYTCYVHGVDSIGRYGAALQISFTTTRIGKLKQCYSSLQIASKWPVLGIVTYTL